MGVVWVVGSLNVDLVSRVQELPGPGETVTGTDFQRLPGGKGANQAVAAARAGAVTRLIGRVGDDALGTSYLQRLTELGVDVSGVTVQDACATGQAVVLVDASAENCIVVLPGANGRLDAADVARLTPVPGDVVVLQLEVPRDVVAQALRVCREAGARSVLNLAPYTDLQPATLDDADVVVVNEHEGRQLAGAGMTPAELVVTRGADGASWGALQAARAADHVVDTTGAGDAFVGALAAALATGADRGDALRSAVDAGARAVAHAGAQGWAFDAAPKS